jgi:hypothetical protein
VKALKDLIAERCSALARNMRLISKGKTLADEDSLAGAGLSDGAKLMMLAGGAPVVSAVRRTGVAASACRPLLTHQERRARLRCLLRAELERRLSQRRHRSLPAEQLPATPLGPQQASSRCATLGSQRCPARCGRAALRAASTCAATRGLEAWARKSLRSAT